MLADLHFLSLILIAVFHFVMLQLKNEWSAVDPINFFIIGFMVIYYNEYAQSANWYNSRHTGPTVSGALVWVSISLFTTVLFYHLLSLRAFSSRLPRLRKEFSDKQIGRLAFIGVFAGFVGWWWIISASGGLTSWASVARGNVNWANVTGYVDVLINLLPVGIITMAYIVFKNRSNNVFVVFLFVLILFLSLLFYTYIGTRSRIIAVSGGILIAWIFAKRKSPSLLFLIPLFYFLFGFVSFVSEYRGYFKDLSFNLSEMNAQEVGATLFPGIIRAEERKQTEPVAGSELNLTVAVIKHVPEEIDYNYGVEFLQFFTQPIPRAIWEGKRYPKNEAWSEVHLLERSSTTWVTHVEVPFLAGPAPGHVASWYYIGGAVGIVVGSLAIALTSKLIQSVQHKSRGSNTYLLLAFILTPVNFNQAVSHPFNVVYTLGPVLIPLFIAHWLFAKPPRKRFPDRGGIVGSGINRAS